MNLPDRPTWEMIDWQIFLLRKRNPTLIEVATNHSFGEEAQKAAKRILDDRGVLLMECPFCNKQLEENQYNQFVCPKHGVID